VDVQRREFLASAEEQLRQVDAEWQGRLEAATSAHLVDRKRMALLEQDLQAAKARADAAAEAERHAAGKGSLSDAKSSLGDAKSSLSDAESSLGDANSSLGDAKSSLCDAKSSLGDA
jgi:chromosome segregation ATPase